MISVNSILQIVNGVLLAFSVLAISTHDLDYFNWFFLILVIYLFNAFLILISFVKDYSFLKIYCLFFTINYLFRIPVLIYKPENNFYFDLIPDFIFNFSGLYETIYVLTYYYIGLGILLLFISSRSNTKKFTNYVVNSINSIELNNIVYNILCYYFIILSLYWLFCNFILQINRDSDIGLLSYVNIFMCFDVVFDLVFLIGVSKYSDLTKKSKYLFYICLAVFSLTAFSGGSRGFMTIPLTLYSLYLLVFYKNYRIPFSFKLFIIYLFVLFTFIFTFLISDKYRHAYRSTNNNISIEEIFNFNNYMSADQFINWASHRTSRFDVVSLFITREDDRVRHIISPLNSIKTVINNLVLGEVWTDGGEKLFPSNLALLIDYVGLEHHLVAYNNNYVYGLFGTMIANSGVIFGFILMIILTIFYMKFILFLYQIIPIRFRPFGAFYLFYMYYSFISMSAFDIFLMINIYTLQQLLQFGIFLWTCKYWMLIKWRF